jgi:hypothetical protein
MSARKEQYEEPELDRTTVYRGPQSPALQAYVPLPVFGVECMLLLLGIRLIGFWTCVFLPLHLVLAAKTADNPYWVRDMWANFNHRWIAVNKGQYGPGIVTFTPHTSRKDLG